LPFAATDSQLREVTSRNRADGLSFPLGARSADRNWDAKKDRFNDLGFRLARFQSSR
jgi:hypothetical protein